MLAWAEAEARAKANPPALPREVQPIDYVATVPDRVLLLERKVAELQQQVLALHRQPIAPRRRE